MNKVTVTKLPKSKVEVRIEVSAEDLAVFAQKALDEFAKEAQLPGFRPGQAPQEMVKSKIGADKIMDRAAVLAVEATFPAAVAENKLEPLGYPEIAVVKLAEGNPLEYTATVAVYPQAKLPDYKKIAGGFELKRVELTEEDTKRLKMEKERHMREHLREDAMEAIAKETEVEIPEILVERETDKMMRQLKERTPQTLNMNFEDYLKKLGKTEEQMRAEMAKDNEARIKNYLIIQEIAKEEKIEANDADIDAAIKKDGSLEEEAGAPGTDNQIREYYRETLKNEKTFEFIDSLFKKA
jgi:FKBP-type peptidyl-prolyl cis-trans isomerase (trigger factor)